jgi:hypothetical protein
VSKEFVCALGVRGLPFLHGCGATGDSFSEIPTLQLHVRPSSHDLVFAVELDGINRMAVVGTINT